MLHDFKPKESTFRDGTQIVKHVVNEELQRTLHQNECELRIQFHQNDVDNAKKAAEVAQQEFVTATREHFEAKEALGIDYVTWWEILKWIPPTSKLHVGHKIKIPILWV